MTRAGSFLASAICGLTLARWLLSSPFLAGTASAPPSPELLQDHDHAVDAPLRDTGRPASGAPPTSADSLAAFRPDSLKNQAIRTAESAPSPCAGRASPRDSADSVAALLRGRRPAVSVHAGVLFLDQDAQDVFQASLNARLRRDSL